MQPILNPKARLEYIAKYATKGEELSSVFKNVFTNVVRKIDENDTPIQVLHRSW